MHTISVADIKAHLSDILNEVLAGEEVIITRRGRPIVRLEAIKKPLKALPNLRKFRNQFPSLDTSSAQLIKKIREEGY